MSPNFAAHDGTQGCDQTTSTTPELESPNISLRLSNFEIFATSQVRPLLIRHATWTFQSGLTCRQVHGPSRPYRSWIARLSILNWVANGVPPSPFPFIDVIDHLDPVRGTPVTLGCPLTRFDEADVSCFHSVVMLLALQGEFTVRQSLRCR